MAGDDDTTHAEDLGATDARLRWRARTRGALWRRASAVYGRVLEGLGREAAAAYDAEHSAAVRRGDEAVRDVIARWEARLETLPGEGPDGEAAE